MSDERAAGEALLHRLAAHWDGTPGVSLGRMFNGVGLSVSGSIFVFINRSGRLVDKIPETDARRMVDSSEAETVVMGTRTMREWVSLPQPADEDLASWLAASRAAHAYVSSTAVIG